MARTFDIRFARSDGIAALLETPANTFRWRGDGSLRIDGGRLDIQQKRGIHTLLTRHTHFRLDAADLREVAREGDALRIEFGVPGAPRGVLPFWVRNRAEAAEIVRLMPTDRTVESDEPVDDPAPPRRRHPLGLLIGVALVSLIIGVVGTSILGNGRSDDMLVRSQESASSQAAGSMVPEAGEVPTLEWRAITVPTSPLDEPARTLPVGRSSTSNSTSAVSADVQLREAEAMRVESSSSALATGDAAAMTPAQTAYVDTESEPRRFMREALALRSAYIYGQTSPGALENGWWELSVRLYNSPAFDARPRSFLVDAELGLSLNWRASLANYQAALDSGNRERIEAARADLARADELTDEIGFVFR